MKAAIGRNWRDSASLIILAKRSVNITPPSTMEISNYDVLLQTRTHSASFSNSIVFPGGVNEEADSSDHWLNLLKSFGYKQEDFEKLHKPGSTVSPIFADNPVRRHIALRITAIRETFEELGFLIGSSDHKNNRVGTSACVVSNVDVQYWQDRVAKDPLELLNLCKEYNCYPDIWELQYWSNWLTPRHLPKRFDTAFFLTTLNTKPIIVSSSTEVDKVEWSSSFDILDRSQKSQVQLYPPQVYEFLRLSHFKDIQELITFARNRSCHGNELIYGVNIQVEDGAIFLLPGDHLYPSDVNNTNHKLPAINKTILELRDPTKTLHRIEESDSQKTLVLQNYTPEHHVNMGNLVFPMKLARGN